MRLPLLQGRVFGSREHNALVISESAARKLWPNDLPLGKSCLVGQRTRTITSIVKDSGANLMHFPESVEAYTPIDNENATLATILVHATTNRARMSGALRSASTLPGIVPFVFTFQSFMNGQMDTIRNIVTVVVTLGAIASWLAMIGIFGLLAFTFAQRTLEFGIRMALGALGFDILRCVLGQYALPFGIGAVLDCLGCGGRQGGAQSSRLHPFDLLTLAPACCYSQQLRCCLYRACAASVANRSSLGVALRMIHRAWCDNRVSMLRHKTTKWSRSRRFMYPPAAALSAMSFVEWQLARVEVPESPASWLKSIPPASPLQVNSRLTVEPPLAV
jgi:hypothetical protein